MKKLFTLLVVAASCIVGCEKASLGEVAHPCLPIAPDYTMSAEEAEKIAEEAISLIEGLQTKNTSRKVTSCEIFRNELGITTRGGEFIDTLAYVVNFENNRGFAIIAADQRTPSILAMSETGNFNIQEVQADPSNPANVFTRNLAGYQLGQIDEADNSNTLRPGATDPLGPDGEIYRPSVPYPEPWEIITHFKPIVKTEWYQGNPCNTLIPFKDKAGCVTIAIAQIMAYHKKPASYNGQTFDWADMVLNQGSSTSTQRFIKMTFDALPYKDAGSESTDIPDRSVVYCLDEMGYSDDGSEADYDYRIVKSSLHNGLPLYASGTEDRPEFLGIQFEGNIGHAWVIDGYLDATCMIHFYHLLPNGMLSMNPYNSVRHYASFVHCNWGWDTDDSGYFFSGVFDANNKRDYGINFAPQNSPQSEKYFRYWLRLRHNIKP